jgi:hypothetical protein
MAMGDVPLVDLSLHRVSTAWLSAAFCMQLLTRGFPGFCVHRIHLRKNYRSAGCQGQGARYASEKSSHGIDS